MAMNPRLRTLVRALSTWAPSEAILPDSVLAEMKELLRAEFVGAYRPTAVEHGWSLEFMVAAGEHAPRQIGAYRAFVASFPPSERFLGYDPSSVAVKERDRVVSLHDIARPRGLKRPEHYEGLFRAVGASGHDQLRVLVCDGAQVLSWIGATRAEPFTRGERALLQQLVPPLKQRLLLGRHLANLHLRALALDATLEALARPALVVGPGGAVEIANGPARALLVRDHRAVIESIRSSQSSGGSDGVFAITPLGAPLRPGSVLAIQREVSPTLARRVLVAKRVWNLSARQAGVLELIAGGVTNKEIASKLECAEVTVENHVSELFRRSGARSRTDLVGRLFTIAPFSE
jgi:DNA-binding CsgD family transcriptional regulator